MVKTEDSIFPFPWSSSSQHATTTCVTVDISHKTPVSLANVGKRKSDSLEMRKVPLQRLADHLDRYPKLQDLTEKLHGLFPGQVRFYLPRLDALAGYVVQHCGNLLDELIDSQAPVMFKIGFTHNPLWRWGNEIYGYKSSPERWSEMVVMYIAGEPFGPAMLEAALIDKFRGTCAEMGLFFCAMFCLTPSVTVNTQKVYCIKYRKFQKIG